MGWLWRDVCFDGDISVIGTSQRDVCGGGPDFDQHPEKTDAVHIFGSAKNALEKQSVSASFPGPTTIFRLGKS